MYCKFCGEKLSDNCSFCPSCGKPVETAQEGANTAKHDKSQDGYAICPICSTINDISNDTCAKCGVPVIK